MFITYVGMGILAGISFPFIVKVFFQMEQATNPMFCIASLTAGILVGLCNYCLFRWFIKRCNRQLVCIMKEMASGNFDSKVREFSQDEVGEMAAAVNETSRKLNSLLNKAYKDPLTGVWNRNYLEARFHNTLSSTSYTNGTLIFIDVNHFKFINDTYGHRIGDQVLIYVGKKLESILKEEEFVVRYGGDEFVISSSASTEISAEKLAKDILNIFQQPITVEEIQILVSLSLGVSFYPQHADNLAQLIELADKAMYVSKQTNTATYRLAEPL